MGGYLVFGLLLHRPILAHTLGNWDCACGDMYIKTTFRVIWNPFRDRQPEARADAFLTALRANECIVSPELCRQSLPNGRPSDWKLSYREDAHDTVHLYYKLTKFGDEGNLRLIGVGAIGMKKSVDGWSIIVYDHYF